MKKFFLFIGLFLFISKVDAYEIGEWTDELVVDDNVVIKESEMRYKWYKNIINVSPDYYVKDENDALYPNIYLDDKIETDFTEWNEVEPSFKEDRIVESKIVNRYRTLKPVRYIFLNNVYGGFLTFRISEINVLIDNQIVSFELECSDCNPTYAIDMRDGLYEDKAYINNGGSLRIDLGAYYGIEQLKIEIFMYDAVPNTKKFDLYFNEGDTLLDRNYAHKEIELYTVSTDPFQPERHLIVPDESFIETPVYSEWIYIDGFVNRTYYREMQTTSMYRYKDVKYRYYNEERFYLDDYFVQVEDNNYIRDDVTAKAYYLYDYYLDETPDEMIEVDNNNIKNSDNTEKVSKIINNTRKINQSKVIINDLSKDKKPEPKVEIKPIENEIDSNEKSNNVMTDKSSLNDSDLDKSKITLYVFISQISLIVSLITLCISIYVARKTALILSHQK